MAKKNSNGRKLGGTAGIAVIEDPAEMMPEAEAVERATHEPEKHPAKPKKKPKEASPENGNFSVGDIRKAATFANTIGGLDKAIALLQILKVAKEVQ